MVYGQVQPTARKKNRIWPWLVGATIVAVCGVGSLLVVAIGAGGVDDKPSSFATPSTYGPPPAQGQGGKASPPAKKAAADIGEGTWLVGKDVKAGKYRTAGALKSVIIMCYWDVRTDTGDETIIAENQGVIDKIGSPGFVTIKNGQYFKTSGCAPWKLQVTGQGGGGLFTESLNPVGKITYITENLDSLWPVGSAVGVVDRYTSTKAVFTRTCPKAAFKCINIRKGITKGGVNSAIGITRCTSRVCSIVIDTADAKRTGHFNAATKRWLLAHELGHATGLGHRASCVTTMYQYRRCSGNRVPPVSFDAAQRRTMRRH